MRDKLVLLICLLTAAAAPALHADGPAVSATHVWVHETSPGSGEMLGYMTLENLTGQSLALEQIESPDFASVMLHSGASSQGSNQELPKAGLSIAAHQSLHLAPDQSYLVLTKPAKKLYEGDLVTLMLSFSDGSSLTIIAPVRQEPPGN
ncbi:MAG: copper chaperone PCu(A)C [Gammaproteobacteria bacterium]|nr:copper chaperone PCu(A)C [Gammaproteobacteria bacterium]MDE2345706.1 copper chaperone PCu(A)C [Gammaproteobacteria bacterium]